MCAGYRGIFRLRPVGWVGGKQVDRQYMDNVKKRAADLEAACRINAGRSDKDDRQLKIKDVK